MIVQYLRNSLNPDGKIVPITISLTLDALVPHELPSSGVPYPTLIDPEGEGIWILIVSTTERDVDGDVIPPEIIHLVSLDTVHEEIQGAMGRIGKKVDWGALLSDDQSPKLLEITPPIEQTTNVSIMSNIVARIIDPLPATGLNLSTLNMKINGLSIITAGVAVPPNVINIQGNVFDTTITYTPTRVV